MIAPGQSQKGGQGSNQTQVAGDMIVNIGITEERAQEIALATARSVVQDFAVESHEVLQNRVEELDQRVIKSLSAADALDSFADPAFIRSYKHAQEGAAASERPADYDMLAALLTDRAKNPRERPRIVGIDGAIDIVDRIDTEALRALTVCNAVASWRPRAFLVGQGLETLEYIFATLADGPLPEGVDWLDHLDALNVVRRNSFGSMKSMEQFYGEQLIGYIAPGITADEVPQFVGADLLDEPWPLLILPHELKTGFMRIAVVDVEQLESQLRAAGKSDGYLETVKGQAASVFGLGQQDPVARAELMSRIRALPHFGLVVNWWDRNIQNGYHITPIGKALARANAFRLDTEQRLERD
ncbi:LPO_1073/Vpar_1526 family protein [Microbacterium testaceum]|uniref:LPO_1073/Vpar_1526 family protein n=1 Tax=Microbacterium testaceum TaxID=2033 RepID=UPI000734F3CC|nr:LPO_1073/Vpar_1526 family protein [Microbacterium testaceum]KTS01487.1 hypothetical protein NS283_16675 [Microbacterium testaceum]